ncbi:2'-5' RNA ligase [Thermosporothrix hazakensis]|jgi:2'-5' RNA ligase|uniref:RNA 2',3'-cyclic phosphodiesterase n=2 Tax=Thermosporothrix TaxID=768650 RepID=A0A326UH01_THEHA|nr:RNA 2',3'-cyclic phosphodiesterase [Thermosporothrix hazakensis]PZW36220.1 2'-5' RNA ligase [Thermosporothrix hazakensis]BBH88684.1 RNA 2',3'-cyclic phosphodiesterase [Thermosporothrix sp. COM3]GCE46870.1 RNA 2',3'-cyclic phosphodiesterase [Thermosporothrix hazakensis]
MTRTFIALEMNEAQQRHLSKVIGQVAQALPGIRWVDPAGIHLTLAFLGELSDEQLAEAISAAEKAASLVTPFSYRLSRLGSFGSQRQPRVVWMGVDEPSGTLLHLHRVLSRELEQRGFEIDKRPFSPHLTLARIKSPLAPTELQALQTVLTGKQQGLVSTESYPVTQINVMKSELFRSGAKYTCLKECVLKTEL